MALQLQGRMEKEFMGVSVIYYIQRTPRTHQGLVRLELVSPSEKIVCGVSYACYTFRLPRNCHYYLCAVVTVANKCGLRDQSPYIYLNNYTHLLHWVFAGVVGKRNTVFRNHF